MKSTSAIVVLGLLALAFAVAAVLGAISNHEGAHEPVTEGSIADGSVATDAGFAGHLASLGGTLHASGDAGMSHRIHGAMDCGRCHDPEDEATPPAQCESCHRGYFAEQIHTGPPAHGECNDCHEAHADRAQPAVDCLACHTYPERGHDWAAMPGEATDAMRDATRARITHDGNCASCHEPHTGVASEARCVSCHAEEASALATLPSGSHETCASCHEPHEPQPTAAVCASCHTDVHARDASIAQHRDCLSCHEAHHGRPTAREACASCHQSAHAQTLASVAQHRDCRSCHEEHGAPLAPTSAACTSCHESETRAFAVAQVPDEHRCQSCHAPHRFAADGSALTRCASCHTDAVALHASHRGECTSCHEEHGAPIGAAASCTASACHRDVHPTVVGHQDCRGCHTPHDPAATALRTCASCHADEVRDAARWPRNSPHAGECTACHEAHDETGSSGPGVTPSRRCASCHTAETSRSHTGAHDGCIGCHAPHRAPPEGPSMGEARAIGWSSCASCHRAESIVAAGASGTHGQCSACHETPGPPLPTCESCHAERDRPLAHALHAATPCASCHQTHGTIPPVRATCLACHSAQRDHFRESSTCQSCHPFR